MRHGNHVESGYRAQFRGEIQQRVANFKAQQQKFQRAREAHYNAIISETRATPRNQAQG